MRAIKCLECTLLLSIIALSVPQACSGTSSQNLQRASSRQRKHRVGAWTRPSSDSFHLADISDKCYNLNAVAERLVVVAVHKEDISWLETAVELPFLAYWSRADGETHTVRTHGNGAKEASAYLQFITEYYNCLPEITAFIHAHRSSWHSEDMVGTLRRLNWTSAEAKGYLPLHEHFFQPYGMYFISYLANPAEHLQTVLEPDHPEAGEAINGTIYNRYETFAYRQAQEIAYAWEGFFGPAGLGAMPPQLQYYCCAQFLATIERIRALPRDFYLKAVYWSEHWEGTKNFGSEYTRALVAETVWHVIFGESAFLPKASSNDLCKHFACDK